MTRFLKQNFFIPNFLIFFRFPEIFTKNNTLNNNLSQPFQHDSDNRNHVINSSLSGTRSTQQLQPYKKPGETFMSSIQENQYAWWNPNEIRKCGKASNIDSIPFWLEFHEEVANRYFIGGIRDQVHKNHIGGCRPSIKVVKFRFDNGE